MKMYLITGCGEESNCKNITPRLPNLTKEQEKMLAMAGITTLVIIGTACINPTLAQSIHSNSNEVVVAMAQSSPEIVEASSYNIAAAVKPFTNILTQLAEPVSYSFMTKGALEYISGKEHEGKKTIKAAIGGFLGVQFIPQVFNIIKTIKL